MPDITFTLTDEECLTLAEHAEYYARDWHGQAKFMVLEALGLREVKASLKTLAPAKAKPVKKEPQTNGASRLPVTRVDG